MVAPTTAAQEPLDHVIRYLPGSPRLVYSFAWQPEEDLDVYVDRYFAGCVKTRRSTSGGVAMRVNHLLKNRSGTQKVVTLC